MLFACPNFLSRIVLTGYENSKSWAFKYMAYPRKEFIKTISKMGLNKQQISYFGTLHDTYHEFAKVFITEFMETNEYKNRLNAIMGALDCYAKHFRRFIFIPVGDISGWTSVKPANHFQNMTVRDDINFTKPVSYTHLRAHET